MFTSKGQDVSPSDGQMPDSLYETRPQGIMVVVFNVGKSSICFVEYNSHDSLQARLIEGIGHSKTTILISTSLCL